MKKMILFFLAVMIFAGSFTTTNAQNKIRIYIFMESVGTGLTLQLWDDEIVEGQEYVLEEKELTGSWAVAQGLYDALVGASFMFEDGSLDEDITLMLKFEEVDLSNGLYSPDMTNPFFLKFDLTVWDYNFTNPLAHPYYFNDPNNFRMEIPKTAGFANFLVMAGFLQGAELALALMQPDGSYTSEGLIEIENTADKMIYEVLHFSKLRGGNRTILDVDDENLFGVPNTYVLDQNFPNPFNPTTTISYGIPERGNVELNVYNVLGVKVATLVSEVKEPGTYEARFDASGLASGMYLYELRSGNVVKTRKMVYVK